jgi:hypothetical protein
MDTPVDCAMGGSDIPSYHEPCVGSLYALPCLVGVNPRPFGSIVEFFLSGPLPLSIVGFVHAGLGSVGCRGGGCDRIDRRLCS